MESSSVAPKKSEAAAAVKKFTPKTNNEILKIFNNIFIKTPYQVKKYALRFALLQPLWLRILFNKKLT